MADPFVGEIRWLPYSRPTAPTGWLFCDGSQQPISTYEILYTLIGTTYGGNGVSTFGLPDLRGRVPLHYGSGGGLTPHPIGSAAGTEEVTLLSSHLPSHTHTIMATSNIATSAAPIANGTVAAIDPTDTFYTTGNGTSPIATLSPQSVTNSGTGLPHDNCAPTLTINACICFAGIFPQQS